MRTENGPENMTAAQIGLELQVVARGGVVFATGMQRLNWLRRLALQARRLDDGALEVRCRAAVAEVPMKIAAAGEALPIWLDD